MTIGDAADRAQLGERLKSWREGAGISQRAFATDAGIQQPTVSNYESGKRDVPFFVVLHYAISCGVSLDLLTTLTYEEALAAGKVKPRKAVKA